MDVREFIRAMARRWYLTTIALVLCIVAGVLVFKAESPTYNAEATTLLLPPEAETIDANTSGQPIADNPLLYLGGLTQTRDVLMRRLRSESVTDKVTRTEKGVTYDVEADLNSSGPVVVVTAKAPSAQRAIAVINAVQKLLPTELDHLQGDLNVKRRYRITSFPLTADRRPTLSHKSQIRAAIVVVVGLGGASFLGIGLLDGILLARRREESAVPLPAKASRSSGPRPQRTEHARRDDPPQPQRRQGGYGERPDRTARPDRERGERGRPDQERSDWDRSERSRAEESRRPSQTSNGEPDRPARLAAYRTGTKG